MQTQLLIGDIANELAVLVDLHNHWDHNVAKVEAGAVYIEPLMCWLELAHLTQCG